jgi:hypothetical protein
MRVRSYGFATLALGILIGAGGCTSESPTSPLVPARPAAAKGGYIGGGQRAASDSVSIQSGYIGGGQRMEASSLGSGYIGGGQ